MSIARSSEQIPTMVEKTKEESNLGTTIAQNEHLVLKLYNLIGLDSNGSSYLINNGVQSIIAILKSYEHDVIYNYVDKTN